MPIENPLEKLVEKLSLIKEEEGTYSQEYLKNKKELLRKLRNLYGLEIEEGQEFIRNYSKIVRESKKIINEEKKINKSKYEIEQEYYKKLLSDAKKFSKKIPGIADNKIIENKIKSLSSKIKFDKIQTGLQNISKIAGKSKLGSFANALSGSMNKVSAMQKGVTKLGLKFGMSGKAAAAAGGPIGIIVFVLLEIGKAAWKVYKDMAKLRREMGEMSASVGDAAYGFGNASLSYKIASKVITQTGEGAEEVKKTMAMLTSGGFLLLKGSIKDVRKTVGDLVGNMLKVRMGFRLSNDTISQSIKLFNQEYKIKRKADVPGALAKLTSGYSKLKMTRDQYAKTLLNESKQYWELGINVYSFSNQLKRASNLGFGAARSIRYVNDMMLNIRKSAIGSRAYLAEQLGIAKGSPIAGAFMLKYAPKKMLGLEGEKTLGERAVELSLKKVVGMSKEQFQRLSQVEKYKYAGQVAMFAQKTYNLSETTIMESFKKFGLELRKEVLPKDIGKKQLETAQKQADTLYEMLSIDKKVGNWISKVGYNLKSIFVDVMEKITGSEGRRPKKHSGGMIEFPKYHNGLGPDETAIIAKVGEGVLSKEVGVPTAGGPDAVRQMNMGIPPTGGGRGQLDINVNIEILKPYIEEAINRALLENSQVVMFG